MRYSLCLVLALLSCVAATPYDALLRAVDKDDEKSIQNALRAGADLDRRHQDNENRTPLMQAVLGGKAKAVRALLDAGASCSIAENMGYTPIQGAGFHGQADIMQMLIDHGNDPAEYSKDG